MRTFLMAGTFAVAASLGNEGWTQADITQECRDLFTTIQDVIDLLADFGLDWEDAVPTGNVDRANASGDYDFQVLMTLLNDNDAGDCKKYLIEDASAMSPA